MAPKKQNQRPMSSRVVPVPTRDELAAFWDKVDRSGGPDACWMWTGNTDKYRYGSANYRREKWGAHQLAWVFSDRLHPRGVEIDHRCRERACCNPTHMRLSTREGNARNTGEHENRYADNLDAIFSRLLSARLEHGEWIGPADVAHVLGIKNTGSFRDDFSHGEYGQTRKHPADKHKKVNARRQVRADAVARYAYNTAFGELFGAHKKLFTHVQRPETLDYHAEMTAVLADYNAVDGAA